MTSSSIGAPSQRSQSSRKGKRAWRKNVDLDEVEEGLEELRTEERLSGAALQKKKDGELFHIDVTGDNRVRKTLPKFSERVLTSTKILAQRSAVPAVLSRAGGGAGTKRKPALSHDDKTRLLRVGKRLRRGPSGRSALLELSEAASHAGSYDVWAGAAPGAVSAPQTDPLRAHIAVPAVPAPHEGTSYNPPVTAHQELLRTAHEAEEEKLKGVEKLENFKATMEQARWVAAGEATVGTVQGVASGMKVAEVVDEADEADGPQEALPAKKMPERKTKQQRKKAEKLRAEKRLLAEKAARKRLLASVDSAKAFRKTIARDLAARERLREQRQSDMQEKLKQGLAGKKVGKHVVPNGPIDVQLGEELSESLRGLKPEGNLFRDRFVSMQHRALVEPHALQLSKKAKTKTKEYEKHSYKRFDREH
ncbi:P60-like protein [Epithele typhae]|uniref:P60-like protein n=1 Tax=Epithele typhae TaxID=378194 RepID=UPI0020081174|nr:P60-like protein [Epithele typhae]KAH9929103.1 P60-like protein [Epithele typhae]